MKYKCIKDCFILGKLYRVGEELETEEKYKYFVPVKEYKEEKAVEVVDEPKTFYELQQKEAKDLIEQKKDTTKKTFKKKASKK